MSEKQFCSCCLAKQCNKNMANEYTHGNRKEVYGEMIINTFGIIIPTSEKQKECFICEDCIIKLRDASIFKNLVLATQKAIEKEIKVIENDLKIESEEDFDDEVSSDLEDSHFDWDDKDDSQNGDILVIKLNSRKIILNQIPNSHDNVFEDLSKIEKTESKKAVIESNKSKTVNRFDIALWKKKEGAIRKKVGVPVEKNQDVKVQPTVEKKKNVKVKKKVSEIVKATPKKTRTKNKSPSMSVTKMAIDARENTMKLIINSNLCLFRSLKTKFGCILCKTTFADPLELKKHFATHDSNKSLKIILDRVRQMRGLSCKNAEITDLKCKICSENITDLNELITHLKDKHDVAFSGTDILLIPYKLGRGNQCVLCETVFNSFLRLSIHMNSHYPHNVCEVCGLSFISRLSLRAHMLSMHREKKCPHCPAKFLTLSSKAKHLRKDHKICNRKSYCNLCDKVFTYTHQIQTHKVEEHGAKKLEVNCDICGKVYGNVANLRTHVRAVHIRERKYPCQVCGTSFFTKADQTRHERTHNDVRSFCCNYCDAKFKSKDSCRRHMRRLHGETFK